MGLEGEIALALSHTHRKRSNSRSLTDGENPLKHVSRRRRGRGDQLHESRKCNRTNPHNRNIRSCGSQRLEISARCVVIMGDHVRSLLTFGNVGEGVVLPTLAAISNAMLGRPRKVIDTRASLTLTVEAARVLAPTKLDNLVVHWRSSVRNGGPALCSHSALGAIPPSGRLPVPVTPNGPSDIVAYPMTPRMERPNA